MIRRSWPGVRRYIQDPQGENRPPTYAGYQLLAAIFGSLDQKNSTREQAVAVQKGGTHSGVWVSEESWGLLRESVLALEFVGSVLDGAPQEITLSSGHIKALVSLYRRQLDHVHQSGVECCDREVSVGAAERNITGERLVGGYFIDEESFERLNTISAYISGVTKVARPDQLDQAEISMRPEELNALLQRIHSELEIVSRAGQFCVQPLQEG